MAHTTPTLYTCQLQKSNIPKLLKGVVLLARVNIENQIWTDPRVDVLAKLIKKDRFAAIGRLAYLWNICTEQGAFEMKKESIDILFKSTKNFSDKLVESGLGSLTNSDRIRICGAEERLSWLKTMREKGKSGGIKSGISRNKIEADGSIENEPTVDHASNPLTLTLTPTLALTPTLSQTGGGDSTPTTPVGNFFDAHDLLNHWSDRFEAKYGTRPTKRTPKHLQVAKSVLQRLEGDLEKSKTVVSYFFEKRDDWYLKRGHDLETMLSDIDKLLAEAVYVRQQSAFF